MWKQASQRVAVGLALLALPSLPALAQETQWEQCVSAGRTALEERRYEEAEKQFKAALEEAEGFGPVGSSNYWQGFLLWQARPSSSENGPTKVALANWGRSWQDKHETALCAH